MRIIFLDGMPILFCMVVWLYGSIVAFEKCRFRFGIGRTKAAAKRRKKITKTFTNQLSTMS